MRWRYQIIAVLLCFTVLSSGCMGSQEIDDLSFVLTIGVDKAEEPGMYIFTFRIAMPRAFTGEGGGDNKDKTKLVSVKAPAIGEAVRQLAIAMNRPPELSHASALFVHEEVAKEGIYDLVALFLRSRVYRNTIIVLVTKEDVKSVMEKNTSPFELFQYRWVDSVRRTQKLAANYAINSIRKFYINTADPQRAIMTAYGSIIDKSLDKVAPGPLKGQIVPQYNAEDFPREGGTELIVVGSAVFYNWKMVGTLNSSEALGANILDKGVDTTLTIPDPIERQQKVSLGISIKRPTVKVKMKAGKMYITVNAKVTCELADAASGVDYTKKENQKVLEQQMNEAIKANIEAYFKATQPLGADCVQVSNQYRSEADSWQEWAEIDWPEAYKNAEVEINVETSLKRSGLLWRYTRDGEQ